MKIIAFDPGETIGVAIYDSEKPLTVAQWPLDKLPFTLEEENADRCVVESYRIRPTVSHAFSKVETIQSIGIIKSWAKRKGIPLKEQEPSILPVGCGWAGIPYDKKKHLDHHLSALAHLVYFMGKELKWEVPKIRELLLNN